MADKTYNGWTNYETWNVALWIDNEQGSYRQRCEMAQECWDQAEEPSVNARLTGREPFSRYEKARMALERALKSWIEDDAPDLGASLYSDLLGAALQEVDWREIAENFLEDVDKEEEAVEEEEVE